MDEGEIERLLGRCALGDRSAFGRLYAQAAPKLFGVSLRILGHRGDAEEATQEAFVRIWQNAGRFQAGRGSGPGWIVAIARNAAIDRVRARKAPTRDIADMVDLADPGPTPEASAEASDDRRRIEGCLARLPGDRAQAVRAAYVEGHSYDDLARRFDVPLNTMRTWLRRALIALRKCLEFMSDASFLDDLPDDPDAALAAEYVLRLLDPAEEAACAARIAREPGFAAEVERWQTAFSALDTAFASVAPPPRLRARIEERLFGRPSSLLARLWGSAPLWRGVATAAVLGALAFGYLGRTGPEPEPPQLVATVNPIVGDVQLVALVDRDAGLLRFSRLAGSEAPGRSFELWLLPEGETVPAVARRRPRGRAVRRADPGGLRRSCGPGARILVSDEVAGGSTTGLPGPVLAGGAVSEL